MQSSSLKTADSTGKESDLVDATILCYQLLCVFCLELYVGTTSILEMLCMHFTFKEDT